MNEAAIKAIIAKYPAAETKSGNIRTSPVRLSYPHLFKPHVGKKFKNAEPRYSVTLLFPKGSDLELLREACRHAAISTWGSKWQSMKVELPFLDQGAENGPDGAGAVMIRCTSTKQIPVVLADGRTPAKETDIYPGAWGLVSLRPYTADYGTKRVTLGLQAVQKIADGERLAGASLADPEDEFVPIDMADSGLVDESAFG